MLPYLSLSDEALYAYVKSGDRDAFTEIYQRYKKPLLVYALQKVASFVAEDLIHDLFVKLWDKRESITINEKFDAYIFRALRNRIIDFLAHSVHVQKYQDSLNEFSLQHYADLPDFKLREESFLANIDLLLLKFGSQYQQIMRMRVQGFSNQEIADELGMSEKTVRNKYVLILKHIKHKLPVLLFIAFCS